MKFTNKGNIWQPDGHWFFEETADGEEIHIANATSDEVYEVLEHKSNGEVSLNTPSAHKSSQLWIQGEQNDDGYFTLKAKDYDRLLTATSNGFKTEGK